MFGGGQPGVTYKIAADIDANFLAAIKAAREGTLAASAGGHSLADSLKGVSLTSKEVAATLTAGLQPTHALADGAAKLTKEWVQCEVSASSLTDKLKNLTKAQAEAAEAALSASNNTLAGGLGETGKAAVEAEFKLKGLQKIATSIFKGKWTGAELGMLGAIGKGMAELAAPMAAITALAGLGKQAIDAWGDAQKKAGEEIEKDSHRIAEQARNYHALANAITAATNAKAGFPKVGQAPGADGTDNKFQLMAAIELQSRQLAKMAPGDINWQMKKALEDPNARKDKINPLYSMARGLPQKNDALLSQARQDVMAKKNRYEDLQRKSKLESYKDSGLTAQQIVPMMDAANNALPDAKQDWVKANKEYEKMELASRQANAAAEGIIKLTDTLDQMGKRDTRIKNVTDAFRALNEMDRPEPKERYTKADVTDIAAAGDRRKHNMTGLRDLTKSASAADDLAYKKLYPGSDTSDVGLLTTIGKSENQDKVEMAKKLLMQHKAIADETRAIAADEKATDKAKQEANKNIIAQLQEQIELRKSMGRSSLTDEIATVEQQLGILKGKDKSLLGAAWDSSSWDSKTMAKDDKSFSVMRNGDKLTGQSNDIATHNRLLGSLAGLKKQKAEESMRNTLEPLEEQYKELQSQGDTTAAQLTTANNKIAAAAAKWRSENAAIIAQYDSLDEAVKKITAATKVSKGHILSKMQTENLTDLKTRFVDREAGALNTRARLEANKAEVEEVNAAYEKGLISQKQHTEQLNTLTKARTSMERTITNEMEAQKKAVDAQKVSLAKERLSRYAGAVARGEGGAFAVDKKESLTKELLSAELKAIDDEYQAAIKGGKGQVLAAEEASLKKKRLWESETEKFRAEQDAQTNAQKQADKDRVGGSASPLVGLDEGAAFSGLKFSGFKRFGEGFGKFAPRHTAFDDFQSYTLPDKLNSVFKQQQSYEKPASAASKGGGDTYNVHMNPQFTLPSTQQLLAEVGRLLGEEASRRALRVGPGAPSMTRDSVA